MKLQAHRAQIIALFFNPFNALQVSSVLLDPPRLSHQTGTNSFILYQPMDSSSSGTTRRARNFGKFEGQTLFLGLHLPWLRKGFFTLL